MRLCNHNLSVNAFVVLSLSHGVKCKPLCFWCPTQNVTYIKFPCSKLLKLKHKVRDYKWHVKLGFRLNILLFYEANCSCFLIPKAGLPMSYRLSLSSFYSKTVVKKYFSIDVVIIIKLCLNMSPQCSWYTHQFEWKSFMSGGTMYTKLGNRKIKFFTV